MVTALWLWQEVPSPPLTVAAPRLCLATPAVDTVLSALRTVSSLSHESPPTGASPSTHPLGRDASELSRPVSAGQKDRRITVLRVTGSMEAEILQNRQDKIKWPHLVNAEGPGLICGRGCGRQQSRNWASEKILEKPKPDACSNFGFPVLHTVTTHSIKTNLSWKLCYFLMDAQLYPTLCHHTPLQSSDQTQERTDEGLRLQNLRLHASSSLHLRENCMPSSAFLLSLHVSHHLVVKRLNSHTSAYPSVGLIFCSIFKESPISSRSSRTQLILLTY